MWKTFLKLLKQEHSFHLGNTLGFQDGGGENPSFTFKYHNTALVNLLKPRIHGYLFSLELDTRCLSCIESATGKEEFTKKIATPRGLCHLR